jgi:DNA-binding NtrC family response regulator
MAIEHHAAEVSLISTMDDDEAMRNSTRRLISAFGFRAEAFAPAREFLKLDRVKDTACLILDVWMPRRALAWNYNVSSATTPVGFQPFSLPPEDNSEPNKTS